MIIKEIKKIFKEKMKKLDFEVKGNYARKLVDEKYQVNVILEHHPYQKAYYLAFGVSFLIENCIDYSYNIDWDSYFLFSRTKNQNLNNFDLSKIQQNNKLIDYFDYQNRTIEEFIEEFDINLSKRLPIGYNKDNILNDYKEKINTFCTLPIEKIKKIVKLGEFDIDEINKLREKYGYSSYLEIEK